MKQQEKKSVLQGRKEHDKLEVPLAAMSVIDLRYKSLTCYNCREPGHFVRICTRVKVCFICSFPGHYMTKCPNWKKPQPIAVYMGSVGTGLGFYHIDLPNCETTIWLNISKCGVVEIGRGGISLQELENELSEIFCTDWPW
jgi:hypothetical protein